MHKLILLFALLGSVSALEASTLPFPTSDLDHRAQDHNHSYGLMTHATSHGFMTHGLKIQGSLPEDTIKTTAPGTWPDTGGYAQSYPNHPSFLNSTQRLAVLQPGSNPIETDSPVGFRLGSGAVTPQSLFTPNEVSENNSVDRYNIDKTFLSPKKEPGANTNTIIPVVHPNPNKFRTTTSTVLYLEKNPSGHLHLRSWMIGLAL